MVSTAYNGRFGAMAAVPRRQFCAKLHVITPQQVQCKPPLPQAAGTLSAMLRKCVCETESVNNNQKLYLCKKYNLQWII